MVAPSKGWHRRDWMTMPVVPQSLAAPCGAAPKGAHQMLSRIAFAATLLGVLTVTGAALAGNSGGLNKSPSSWISAPRVVSSTSPSLTAATSEPRYGDVLTFDVSTNQTSNPFVNLLCYQNGTLVLNG